MNDEKPYRVFGDIASELVTLQYRRCDENVCRFAHILGISKDKALIIIYHHVMRSIGFMRLKNTNDKTCDDYSKTISANEWLESVIPLLLNGEITLDKLAKNIEMKI